MSRSQLAMLVALGIDDFGSGLFLPLALVYATRVVGLPLSVAGTVVAVGTVIGLLVPPIAGRAVDRFGPRPVVISAQLIQAAATACYLLADGAAATVVAAALLAGGQQAFYSSLFSLISDVAGDVPKDRPFAMVGMVRSASFGLGSLVAALLLSWADLTGCEIAVVLDGVSFLACGVLLAVFVRAPHTRHSATTHSGAEPVRGPLRSPIFLALTGITMLCVLTMDFFLVGMPIYILDVLHGPTWLPGAVLAVQTALISIGATTVVRLTRGFARTTLMSVGAALAVVWCLDCMAALAVPGSWRPAWLLAATLILAPASMLVLTRANAVAEAVAPRGRRGQYLAAFQYAFTVAQVLAPAVVGLFAAGPWAPWLLVGAAAAAASVGLRWITGRLPAHAVYPADTPVPSSA